MGTSTASTDMLAVGTEVEVFSTYRRHWLTGFQIAAVLGDMYALRRNSDGAILGGTFSARQVRERHPIVA